MRLWLDLDDVIDHAALHAQPTGIQRVSLELAAALVAAAPDRVGLFRGGRGGGLHVLDASILARLRAPQPAAPLPARDATAPVAPHARLAPFLPPALRRPLIRATQAQGEALRALAEAVRATPALWRADSLPGGEALRAALAPGDVVASLGAPWPKPEHVAAMAEAAAVRGARLAFLVHDAIPLSRPDLCEAKVVARFTAFARDHLPRAAHVLSTSHATAAALRNRAALATDPVAIGMGTTFDATPAATLPDGLRSGGYVLMVGTLEPRKNHALAFRAWQRLLAEGPTDAVPPLVFAGRRGWRVDDLLAGIAATRWLDGHVRWIAAPGDAQLAALYRGARFTLFPSHDEGWGLPVSESLACGTPCIASDRGGIREAGGAHVRTLDPDNVSGAHDVIRAALRDPAGLAALTQGYRPRPWDDVARAVLRALG